jgi:hypothetical protein
MGFGSMYLKKTVSGRQLEEGQLNTKHVIRSTERYGLERITYVALSLFPLCFSPRSVSSPLEPKSFTSKYFTQSGDKEKAGVQSSMRVGRGLIFICQEELTTVLWTFLGLLALFSFYITSLTITRPFS